MSYVTSWAIAHVNHTRALCSSMQHLCDKTAVLFDHAHNQHLNMQHLSGGWIISAQGGMLIKADLNTRVIKM